MVRNNSFVYKSYCEFVITSDLISPEKLTSKLKIEPNRFFKKGDKKISKHSGSIIERTHNLWAIKSEVTISAEESISNHIMNLRSRLEDQGDVMKDFKNNPDVELTFWIWVETDNSGVGIDLTEKETGFLNDYYFNTVHFSFLTNEMEMET